MIEATSRPGKGLTFLFMSAVLVLSLPLVGHTDGFSIATTGPSAVPNTLHGVPGISVVGFGASISPSGTTADSVNIVVGPGNSTILGYNSRFSGEAYAGGTTVLINNVTDLGSVPIGITSLTVDVGFGTYFYPLRYYPYPLSPHQEETMPVTIRIPNDTRPRDYWVTTTIMWMVNPVSIYEHYEPDFVAYGYLTVFPTPASSTPPPLPKDSTHPAEIWQALGYTVLGVIVAVAAVAVMRRKKRARPRERPWTARLTDHTSLDSRSTNLSFG